MEYDFSLSDSAANWNDAQASCSGSQKNLASITSGEVQGYLIPQLDTSQLNDPVWIGGSDSNTEGNLEWIDSTAFSFKNPLPPDANDETKDCLAFSPGSNTG